MRDNVSIIFAAIFAVLLLIVFPLFSLLTRQDNIAYNKVLTITTEFVDSVRTKGYFTEKEYTDYLVKLAATQNTYKVDMECHKKLLIKDVENYTDANPIWVEDTAVYYNSYIGNELKSSGSVGLEEGDEFYIKVYNTNITTASLMYNFFLGSSIPRKVINIGYGGKILNSTGDTFAKTTFNSSYTPYVTFGEVVNNDGENFKYCYDQQAGTYDMQYCIRIIDIEDENNNPIKVNFKLHNFAKIGDRDLNSVTFDDNMSYFIDTIKENVVLRGNYVDTYDITIDNLRYVADRVEGTISIENISMSSGAWQTKAYIVITSNLGTGPTGASSSEGTTEELTLRRRDISSNVVVDGPYLSKTDTEVVTSSLTNKETVYYKVTLRDSNGIKKLELYDTLNSKTISTYGSVKSGDKFSDGQYDITVEKTSTSNSNSIDEYWLSVTPTYEAPEEKNYLSKNYELQIGIYADTYIDLNVTSEVKSLSKVAFWQQLGVELHCSGIGFSEPVNGDEGYNKWLRITFDNLSWDVREYIWSQIGAQNFIEGLVESGLLYITRGNSDKKYKISVVDNTVSNCDSLRCFDIGYYEEITGGPEETEVYINFQNSDGTVVKVKTGDYANIPNGFKASKKDGNLYIYESYVNHFSLQNVGFYWVPAEESDIKDSNVYYDSNVTSARVRSSIRKYGGFWIADRKPNWSFTFGDGGFEYALNQCRSYSSTSSTWFTYMMSGWQLDCVYKQFGKNSPIAVDTTYSGGLKYIIRYWVAETSGTNVAKAACWNGNGYSYESYNKTDKNDKAGVRIYTLQVLYLE